MPLVPSWYSKLEPHGPFHFNDRCPIGTLIESYNRVEGHGDRSPCPTCIDLCTIRLPFAVEFIDPPDDSPRPSE